MPFEKTIDEYDFNFHESLDKRMVMELFYLEFVGCGEDEHSSSGKSNRVVNRQINLTC
ncbi:hypothetical protein [Candidatus Magnetominusculus xianensis]|uniref:hypothetical protein n=1 Tax=Candidatus Magnetominusculus xianensis TaxID=1748249 RepID=UPI0019F96211|nr:hypothetical protein [Candidatus Magnetominusculus xianensis]MBF0403214.1 hypothetical protein [Nitrospirota bacterium]